MIIQSYSHLSVKIPTNINNTNVTALYSTGIAVTLAALILDFNYSHCEIKYNNMKTKQKAGAREV